MNWLALLREIENDREGTLQNLQKPPSVGFVGTPSGHFQKNEAAVPIQQNALTIRIQRLCDKDVDADLVMQELALRDNRNDDRHMCLECKHLNGIGNQRYCRQGRNPEATFGNEVPKEMLATLHRCRLFVHFESPPKIHSS